MPSPTIITGASSGFAWSARTTSSFSCGDLLGVHVVHAECRTHLTGDDRAVARHHGHMPDSGGPQHRGEGAGVGARTIGEHDRSRDMTVDADEYAGLAGALRSNIGFGSIPLVAARLQPPTAADGDTAAVDVPAIPCPVRSSTPAES